MFTTEYRADHAIVTDTDTPNVRYIAMQDTDTESPAHWGDYDVYVYRASRWSGTDEGRAHEHEATRAFFHALNELCFDADDALAYARRFMRIFHGWSAEQADDNLATYSARGYSQSDWWDILVIDEDGIAESSAKLWEQWARGDVWFVFPEQFIPCPHPESCHAITRCAHWSREPFDHAGLGGIYADDAIEAVKHYLSQW